MSDSTTAVFDMEAFRKRIEETVIANMGSLLPEEQLVSMIKTAIDKFFAPSEQVTVTRIYDSYCAPSNSDAAKVSLKVSPFEYIVFKKLQPLVEGAVSSYFEENRTSLAEELKKCLSADQEIQGSMALGMTLLAERQQRLQLAQALLTANHDLRNDLLTRLNRSGVNIHF